MIFVSFLEPKPLFTTLTEGAPPPPVISAEAQAMLDNYANLGVALVDAERSFMIEYVDSEVLSGNYQLKDFEAIMSLAATNQINGLIDYKGGKVMTNNGATFDLNGAAFDGVTDYIDSNYTPSADGINYQQDAANMGAFVKVNNDKASTNIAAFGIAGTFRIIIAQQPPNLYYRANDNLNNSSATSDLSDNTLFITQRTTGRKDLIKDGASLSNTLDSAAGLPTATAFIGAANGAFSNFNGTISTFMAGGALPDQPAHNFNLRALLTGLGTI